MIESVNNEKVKFYKKLREKKYILEYKKYIVEGEHLVKEAYKAGILEEVLLLEGNEIIYPDIKTTIFSSLPFKSISKLQSVPSIMGVVKLIEGKEIKGKKIVLLDNVQDPGNVGTIIRSALAFNVETVVFSEDSVSLYNDKMIRSSEGTIFNMNTVRMNLESAIKEIKKSGITVYYADMFGNMDLDSLDIKDYALVLGSEGQGISESIKLLCDESINIPMNTMVESLNVSVCGGIIMYKFR